MRPFWKKNRRALRFLLCFLLCLSIGSTDCLTAQAITTQQKIDKAEDELDKLESQQEENDSNLDGMKGEKNALQRKLNNLDQQLEEVSQNIESLQEQIEQKEVEIAAAEIALEEAIATQEKQYEDMVYRVKAMYERKQSSYLNAFLGQGGLASLINLADYFSKVESYDKEKLQEYKEQKQEVEIKKAGLERDYKELEDLKVSAEAEHSKISGLIRQAQNSIADYSEQISEAEQKAREYEDAIKEKEADLEYLRKKLEEEKRKSREAANSVWRDISEVSFAESDRYLLANLIYCEAGGEPYEGQVAVGAVVINRVLSSVFPSDITGVIYQSGQFSPVASGRLALALASDKATASCYQAADAAMSGQSNVGNCVFFRTPVEGLTGIQIGGHIFY